MRFEAFSFGSICIDGTTYGYDVVIDRGRIRKRKKKPSKRFRDRFGHTPLSIKEEIPWKCRRLVIGTGTGALPVMEEVNREARRRKIKLQTLPTACRARVDASLRAYPKTGRQSAVQGVRAAFLQRSGPHSGQYVRAPAHGHRRKGWQSVERGPRPVQLNFAQPGQVAG